jgi:FKBP-type peptidyl-prolyl cis-trans isomerase
MKEPTMARFADVEALMPSTQQSAGKPMARSLRARLLLLAIFGTRSASAVDYGMKVQQTLGSARAVSGPIHLHWASAHQACLTPANLAAHLLAAPSQAAESKSYDTALSKLDQLTQQITEWRAALVAEKAAEATPAEPEPAPTPPAESIEFSMNSTHIPDKCTRKSEEGAVMKVHYVGKLISTGKIFASSFHTGSQPFRFVLGSDDVVAAWNQGLVGMCEGERRRLKVPWDMAYGEKGTKGVPPYSDVQYDFELVELSLPKLSPQNTKGKKKKKGKKEEL